MTNSKLYRVSIHGIIQVNIFDQLESGLFYLQFNLFTTEFLLRSALRELE